MFRYSSLPVLQMRNGSYMPMELVDVEPVRVKKITDEQRAFICRSSSLRPPEYIKSINEIRDNPKKQHFEEDPFVRAWNMNISSDMLTLPARVLPMPEIVYTDQYRVTSGSVQTIGRWELKVQQFHTPATFPDVWGIINLTSLHEEQCIDFYNELRLVAKHRGIDCHPPKIYEEHNCECEEPNKISDVARDILNRYMGHQFFIIILPNETMERRAEIYRHWKKMVRWTPEKLQI